ncbi:MAG: tRNA (adenosine(37)-N6)-dimethylallyltransferase MiaA [Proteobacteria bacterium]|nr:tRNA (adenosine(37)-N6)-dimethylallyltransferase MiaA [Pseudomonadota bacterium]
MTVQKPPTLFIMGTTASGKSQLAIAMAELLHGEIISADSIAFYRGFNIASAKPSREELLRVKHHFIDILEPHQSRDVGWFSYEARDLIKKLRTQNVLPIVVGGSGLYLRALLGDHFHDLPSNPKLKQQLSHISSSELSRILYSLDPERAEAIHPNDRVRLIRACEVALLTGKSLTALTQTAPPHHNLGAICCLLLPPKDQLLTAIATRTETMIASGLIAEVDGLLKAGVSPDAKPMKSVGYRQTLSYLTSKNDTIDHLKEAINTGTWQLAKKQRNWFRKKHHDIIFTHSHIPDIIHDLLEQLPSLHHRANHSPR